MRFSFNISNDNSLLRFLTVVSVAGLMIFLLSGTEAFSQEEKKGEPKKIETAKEEPKKGESEKKEEPKKIEPKVEESKPDVVELKKEPLRLTVKLNGIFESKKAETVRLKGEDFSAFELSETVEHGAKVRKGDVLVKFNPKKYEEALVEKKRALRLSEIALQEEEINLKYLESRQPMNKEAMERSKTYADEDLVYYFNVEQEWMKKTADFQLKISQFYVDSSKEELRQLEKMYADDDLIEETEEFVLKRSRFMVEAQEFFYEMNKMRSDRTAETIIPRMEISMREMSKMREMDYRKMKETFDFALEQAKLRIARTRETHAKLVEQFEKFTKDKQMLALRSPADGIVYYGEYSGPFSKGKWNNAASVAAGMKIDEMVKNNQVLFTIIDPKPSQIRATIPEKELHWIDVGTRGVATPTAVPNTRLKVELSERNDYPSPNNDYVAIFSVSIPKESRIYPNMTGSLELDVYDNKESLLVPTAALKREENESDSWNHAYLYVFDGEKTTKKLKVGTGHVKGDKTELAAGIATGAKVYKRFSDGEKAVEKEKKEAAEKAAKEKAEKEKKEATEKSRKEKERKDDEAEKPE